MHVRLGTATFFGMHGCARLDVKAAHGCAPLTSTPYQSSWWCSWNLCLRAQCIVKDTRSIPGQPKIGWRPTRPRTRNYKSFSVSTNKRQCPGGIFICAMSSSVKSFNDCSVSHPSRPMQVPIPSGQAYHTTQWPRQLPTSTTHSTHLLIPQLLFKYIHLVLHACLSALGPLMKLGSASQFVLCSSFCWPKWRRQQRTLPIRRRTNKHHCWIRPALQGLSGQKKKLGARLCMARCEDGAQLRTARPNPWAQL